MFEFALYWMVGGFLALWGGLWFSAGHTGRRGKLRMLGGLVIPLLPYVAVEVQTVLFAPAFSAPVKRAMAETGLLGDSYSSLSVLWMTGDSAKVLVRDDGSAYTLLLREKNGKWTAGEWNAVWSSGGSAEGNTFPPYLH